MAPIKKEKKPAVAAPPAAASPPTQPAGTGTIPLRGWSGAQVQRAVQSLLKYVGQRQESGNALLGDDDEIIYLQLALKRMPQQPRKDKPIPLTLPHALFKVGGGTQVCLFVKDHLGEGHQEAKRRVQALQGRGGVTKVVGLSKLRTKYEAHEAKRELCRAFDLFLADDRILPSLPKLIGKSFFSKKKQPIPIRLTNKDFGAQVRKACANTYLYMGKGTCLNIRVGRSSHTPAQLAANVHAALLQAAAHIPKKWGNIQGVFLKTAESVALPLFQALPDTQPGPAVAPVTPSPALEPAAAPPAAKPQTIVQPVHPPAAKGQPALPDEPAMRKPTGAHNARTVSPKRKLSATTTRTSKGARESEGRKLKKQNR